MIYLTFVEPLLSSHRNCLAIGPSLDLPVTAVQQSNPLHKPLTARL